MVELRCRSEATGRNEIELNGSEAELSSLKGRRNEE